MNVLSLFDGISCGQLALQRAGIPVEEYHAFEIDKYAIQVTQKNFPNTYQHGSVLEADFTPFIGFDLLIGGSPCQDLSIAKKDREGLKGERSKLFFEYVKAKQIIKPKYFLLENVASMSNENRNAMTEFMGVEPIEIDSALLSAQRRKRLFWTNIEGIEQPIDKGLYCSDIVQPECDVPKNFYFTETTEASMKKILERSMAKNLGFRTGIIKDLEHEKFKNLDANYHKGCDGKRSMFEIGGRKRMATPTEAERLQTLPDGYTEGISNTQRYKCIGNGWTVDVIAHILRHVAELSFQNIA